MDEQALQVLMQLGIQEFRVTGVHADHAVDALASFFDDPAGFRQTWKSVDSSLDPQGWLDWLRLIVRRLLGRPVEYSFLVAQGGLPDRMEQSLRSSGIRYRRGSFPL